MPRTINLRQLDAFRSVMLSGTVTQAATMLNISQPAVSRLLHHLEERAKVPLFTRRRGRLFPTPEAELLFQETERAYAGLDRITDFIDHLDSFKTGQINILASTPMSHGIMPRVLRRFNRQYPEVRITFKIVIRREFVDWVGAQNFDLAVATFPIDYPAESSEIFAKTKAVCVMPKGHPLAKRRIIHAENLASEAFISLLPETLVRFRIDQIFDTAGVRRKLMMEAQNSMSVCELVAEGLGVSIVDPFIASKFAASGVVIRPFAPSIEYEFGFLFPLHRPVARPAAQLAGMIRTIAKETAKTFPKL